MTLQEFLSHLQGVKGSGTQYSACCPAHGDTHQSLSVSVGKDGRVLMKCHAGCSTEDIVWAMGLQLKDLFVDITPEQAFQKQGKPQVVATYQYVDAAGQTIAEKLRRADKSFAWRHPDGAGGWAYNRKGVPFCLYTAGATELPGSVFVVEGEKDVDTLHRLGKASVSGMDGAGHGKWKPEYTEQLRGKKVFIVPDNDDVGREYAEEVAAALNGAAAEVRMVDLSTVWHEIPKHGDTTDLMDAFGPEKGMELFLCAASAAEVWKPAPPEEDPLLSCFKSLDEFQEEEAKWLVPGWIPSGQITLMAADGGVGKTTLWCHVIAALSNGTTCILDPPGFTRQPMKITFLTTEDSVRKKLRKKLRLAGANMQNIITPDFIGDKSGLLHKLKFGSPELEKVLRYFQPVLCVFDPVQGFIPPKVNMGSRNEMRDCMAPLISVGEEIETTSLIVCHTNKRKGASGRDRIADSADLWDIARSVMMAGFTEEQGVRYLSNEKNNYAPLQETVLFTIDGEGQIQKVGTCWKRDREYIQEADAAKSTPNREDCKAFILKALNEAGGAMPTADLDAKAKQAGYSFTATKRAKKELKAAGEVRYFQTGSTRAGDNLWHIQAMTAAAEADFVELPEGTPTPFDGLPPSES